MTSTYSHLLRNKSAAFSALIIVIACAFAFSASTNSAWCSADKKAEGWEPLVKKGNEYEDRGRHGDARKYYQQALRILEKSHIDDLRKAIVLNDLAEAFRGDTKAYDARMQELRAAAIYKREIDDHQLGFEYAAKKNVDFESGSLRPHCYLCHENWKVVPIYYGKSNGYPNEAVPNEEDAAYTHKPGGPIFGDQRWYCRDCHQTF